MVSICSVRRHHIQSGGICRHNIILTKKRGVLCHISETLAVLVVLYIPNIIVKYHILNFCNSSRVFLVHEEEEG